MWRARWQVAPRWSPRLKRHRCDGLTCYFVFNLSGNEHLFELFEGILRAAWFFCPAWFGWTYAPPVGRTTRNLWIKHHFCTKQKWSSRCQNWAMSPEKKSRKHFPPFLFEGEPEVKEGGEGSRIVRCLGRNPNKIASFPKSSIVRNVPARAHNSKFSKIPTDHWGCFEYPSPRRLKMAPFCKDTHNHPRIWK